MAFTDSLTDLSIGGRSVSKNVDSLKIKEMVRFLVDTGKEGQKVGTIAGNPCWYF